MGEPNLVESKTAFYTNSNDSISQIKNDYYHILSELIATSWKRNFSCTCYILP